MASAKVAESGTSPPATVMALITPLSTTMAKRLQRGFPSTAMAGGASKTRSKAFVSSIPGLLRVWGFRSIGLGLRGLGFRVSAIIENQMENEMETGGIFGITATQIRVSPRKVIMEPSTF